LQLLCLQLQQRHHQTRRHARIRPLRPPRKTSEPIFPLQAHTDIIEFEVEEDPTSKSFFSEIISSVCDIRFSRDGRHILSRDFLTLKVWDLAMDGRTPLQTINIHDHLRHKLCDLYESDCIFDKFECTFSGDGKHALTGSYNNNFMIYNTNVGGGGGGEGGKEILLQADKSAFKAKKSIAAAKKAAAARGASPARGGGAGGGRATPPPSALARNALDVDSMDFNKKILHLSWHPFEDTVAIAATNNVPSPFPAPTHTQPTLFVFSFCLSLETDFSSSFFLLRRRNV
jgi:serine/threonine-protein phosphatase 2A regulatory subunit B